ncbi:hypothetical protein [Pediococcus ethanolidurans]
MAWIIWHDKLLSRFSTILPDSADTRQVLTDRRQGWYTFQRGAQIRGGTSGINSCHQRCQPTNVVGVTPLDEQPLSSVAQIALTAGNAGITQVDLTATGEDDDLD